MVNPAFLCPQPAPPYRLPIPRPISSTPALESGDPSRLVISHHYLCRRGARKFLRPGVDRRDLEQVAALGLVKAARRYDGATNTPFEAYAWLTILGELLHYVRDHERALRVPRRLRVLEPRLGRAYDACVVRFGREPSESELAAEVGVPPGTLRELRRALAATQTLDLESVAGAEPRRVTGPGLEDRLLLTHALSTLRPLEARVVSGVYFAGLTQQEVAVQLGISARRISRIHQAALARMQRVIAS